MRIFLLGYKGFVGTGIARYLEENKIKYTGIDLDNYEQYKNQSCDIFINANGNSKKRLAAENPKEDFNMNAISTLNTLLDFDSKKYIYISTIDVYEDCSNPKNNIENSQISVDKISNYGLSKYLSEQIVQHYAKEWLIFRLAGMVGKNLKKNSVYDVINLKKVFVHPDSEYQYMNTMDVAKCVYELRNQKSQVYNLCGNGTIKVKEIFDYAKIPIPKECYNLKKETYNVNIDKITKIIEIANTKEIVRRYVEDELSDMQI